MPPPAPAVYREPGGVPIPPNLRPISRAGTAPGKGLPVRAASDASALDARGFGVAGSSRFGRAWGARLEMDSGPGRRRQATDRVAAGSGQTCAGTTQRYTVPIVPAKLGFRRRCSPDPSDIAAEPASCRPGTHLPVPFRDAGSYL